MSDVLSGFETTIEKFYPQDFSEISKFAAQVSAAAGEVRAAYTESEFPQFMAKLDRYKSVGGRSELILGWDSRDTLAGQVCSQVGGPKGAFLPNQWGFTLIDIGQHRFIFISWDRDRRTIRVFQDGKFAASFQRMGIWENFVGGAFDMLSPDERCVASFTFPNLLASMGTGPSWTRVRVRFTDEDIKIQFPNQWPNPGGNISEQLISDFSRIPFEKQTLTVAVLLWSNNSL